MVHREHLELDIQGAVQSGKFTVARDLLIHVQCLNIARRLAGGLLICQDYSHRIRVCGSKGADIMLSVSLFLFQKIIHLFTYCFFSHKLMFLYSSGLKTACN